MISLAKNPMRMQRLGYGTRKIPALATLVSLLTGCGASLGLLSLLHLYRSPYFPDTQQPVLYQILSGVSFTCLLLGAILLWRMKRAAGKLFLAGFLCSLCAMPFFHGNPAGPARNAGALLIGIVFQIIVTAYVWWVTERWQQTRALDLPSV